MAGGIRKAGAHRISGLGGASGSPVFATSGTFAAKPAAPVNSQQYYATDLGTGTWIFWNGTKWKPLTGIATIYSSAVATSSQTGATTELNNANVSIPAGLLSVNGKLRISAVVTSAGGNSTKNARVRFSTTSGTITGSNLAVDMQMSSAQSSEIFIRTISNRNATNSQITGAPSNGGAGQATAANTAIAIDTTVQTFLSFNTLLANAADNLLYEDILVEWME